jgi:hypothetical protein
MSESDVEPDAENPLLKALIEFTGCIGGAVDVCSYSLIHGEGYVPFAPDDDEDDEACEEEDCSQVWVRVTNIEVVSTKGWDDTTCALARRVGLEVGIIRCMKVVPEGEAPSATDMLAYAMQAMEDANALMCSALGCDVWHEITIGQWTPLGPLGGEYGGQWTMTAELV